jgi:Methyltransferase domain
LLYCAGEPTYAGALDDDFPDESDAIDEVRVNYRPKLADHVASLKANIKVFGVWNTFREALSYLAAPDLRSDGFDQAHGVDTASAVYAHEISFRGAAGLSASHYHPAPARVIAHALRELPVRHDDYVFVDFGSGKGRALLVAADFPFQRVVGVEASPTLHDCAVQNIARYHSDQQQCRAIEAHCMDCLDYEFPDANIVLYMYHPFAATVMRDVLKRVARAFAGSTRQIYIVYLSPFHDRVFHELEGFEEVGGCQVMKFDQSWVVYQYKQDAPRTR